MKLMNPRQATKSKALALYKPDYTQNVRVSARGNDLEHVLIGVMSRESSPFKQMERSFLHANKRSFNRKTGLYEYCNTCIRCFFLYFLLH